MIRITPQACHGVIHAETGVRPVPVGLSAIEDMPVHLKGPAAMRPGQCQCQPATCLMRAIISSTAFSTGISSLTTRFIALAQTFSLLRMVNL